MKNTNKSIIFCLSECLHLVRVSPKVQINITGCVYLCLGTILNESWQDNQTVEKHGIGF